MDCYRVVIMQRPPTLQWCQVGSFCQTAVPGSSLHQLMALVTATTNQGIEVDPEVMEKYSTASLAALSVYIWPSIPSMVGDIESGPAIWKPEFAELACDSWARLQRPETKNSSSVILYHVMNISLHTNLALLQDYAHSPPLQAQNPLQQRLNADKSDPVSSAIKMWIKSYHYGIAHWHATVLIDRTESTIATYAKDQAGARQKNSHTHAPRVVDPSGLPTECPHVPYAIYYASLVLWCGAAVLDGSRMAGSSHIVRGGQILAMHKLRIAQRLEMVLKTVK
jgi:hypothetical protein